jgi:hypothetical protein
MMTSSVKATSSAENGCPSCHVTSGRSLIVQMSPSFETPPFSTVGISVARLGMNFPWGSIFHRESKTVNSTHVSTPVFT